MGTQVAKYWSPDGVEYFVLVNNAGRVSIAISLIIIHFQILVEKQKLQSPLD